MQSKSLNRRPFSKRLASVSAILIGNGAGRVACTVVVLRVRPRLCGATVSAPPSTAAHVISNLCLTVIAPLFALPCECALRSFEIAELLLLFGGENVENLGLHAGVRDDQPCQQTCFSIGETFDLLCI